MTNKEIQIEMLSLITELDDLKLLLKTMNREGEYNGYAYDVSDEIQVRLYKLYWVLDKKKGADENE